jgi:hypothetical protein
VLLHGESEKASGRLHLRKVASVVGACMQSWPRPGGGGPANHGVGAGHMREKGDQAILVS